MYNDVQLDYQRNKEDLKMAKFNLKKILVQDYEVDLVQATNFEQWVGKNMDYEAVMEKDFKNISFKSSKTNKKDFLKDLKERALKLEPIKSITDILELFDDGSNKNTELYDKIRKLELELEEIKVKNDSQYKTIKELEKREGNVFVVNEIQEKIISEYNNFLRKFNLGFDITEYEKAIGTITYKRHATLKEILIEKGMSPDVVETSIQERKMKQYSNYKDEIEVNLEFKNYEERREELREQFKFIRENQEFLNACINLKNSRLVAKEMEVDKVIETKEASAEEDDWYNYSIKDLREMDGKNSFYHYTYSGGDIFTSSQRAFEFNYGCCSLKYIALKLGVKTKSLPNGKIYFKATKEEFLKIYNEKTPKRNVLGELMQTKSSKPEQKSFREVLNEAGTI